ncbi:hypothetical protein L7F22_028010 [Adiantum nelumboides]|nr:hypothetical protein [Adiantum nelumboides]
MASGEGQSNPSTSGDAGRDHHEDFGDEYGPPLPTQEELREMEHRRLVGEATNLMLNFAKDPKLAKYMSETAFQDVQAQLKATTTSPPKPDSKKQYSEKELEEELDARLARILGAQKQGKKHDRKRKKSTDFNGYLGSQLTFDKAKKHKKHAAVPSSSSSYESSSESSKEERRSKKRSRRHRHGKAKRKTKKSRSRRADDSSTEDSSTDSSDSEDGHFYANKKNFYKANQYDFLEDKSKKVREFKEGGQSIKFETFSGYKDASKALSFIQQFDIAFTGGRYTFFKLSNFLAFVFQKVVLVSEVKLWLLSVALARPVKQSLTYILPTSGPWQNSASGKAPFEIVEGAKKVPPILQTKDKIFEADKYVQNTDEAYRKIKLALEKTQSKQKKAVDRHRRELVFSLGDWVLLRFEKARLRKMKGKERLFPKLAIVMQESLRTLPNRLHAVLDRGELTEEVSPA